MSGAEAVWRAALAEGRFLLQRGAASGRAFFPPRGFEPGTGAAAEWFEASGLGEVYSVTKIYPKPPAEAYAVVLVTLAEGPRIMSRLMSRVLAEEVVIGMKVRARILDEDGAALLVFEPV